VSGRAYGSLPALSLSKGDGYRDAAPAIALDVGNQCFHPIRPQHAFVFARGEEADGANEGEAQAFKGDLGMVILAG
jgi:hypothetical protein